MNGYNPNKFKDLDLSYDPLSEVPDLEELTYKYVDETRDPFLASIEGYDFFSEDILKKQASLGANQSQLNYEADKLKAVNSLNEIGKVKSKGGFAGAGAYKSMESILTNSLVSDAMAKDIGIASELLGARRGTKQLRERHVEDLWGLYTDFLLADPDVAESSEIFEREGGRPGCYNYEGCNTYDPTLGVMPEQTDYPATSEGNDYYNQDVQAYIDCLADENCG